MSSTTRVMELDKPTAFTTAIRSTTHVGIRLLSAVAWFCVMATNQAIADPISEQSTPSITSTTHQHVLVIPVSYTDHSDAVRSSSWTGVINRYFGATSSLQNYWQEASYGKVSVEGSVHPWIIVDMAAIGNCNLQAAATLAMQTVEAEGELVKYNRVFVDVAPRSGCPGLRGFKSPLIKSYTLMYIGYGGLYTVVHEGGHSLGLGHSIAATYNDGSVNGAIGPAWWTTGDRFSYGNIFDVMGGGEGGLNNRVATHYSAPHKYTIEHLTDDDIVRVSRSGLYVIQPLSTPLTGPKAIRVLRGVRVYGLGAGARVEKEYLWIETRNDSGYDSRLDNQVVSPDNAFGTAIFNVQRPAELLLIDTHPGTASGRSDFLDAPLQYEQEFFDPFTNTRYQHRGVLQDGSISVEVSIDPAFQDTDEDGLTDVREAILGTNLDLDDSDRDGVSDLLEVCYDGNCETYAPGAGDTDANNDDTDGDGLADGEEAQIGSNALTWDTDYDGLNDGEEVALGMNPVTRDAQEDPDADGVNTYLEILRGTNPSSNTSTPTCRTIYAATNGLKTNDGLSPQTPKQISGPGSALATAQACETVSLASGTYIGGFIISKPIRLVGAGDGTVVIGGTSGSQQELSGVSWAHIEGLTFENPWAFVVHQSSNVTVKGNIFKRGLLIRNESKNVELLQNLVYGNTTTVEPGALSGIDVRESSTVNVTNNTIAFNQQGVSKDPSSDVTVRNSILWNNGQGGTAADLVGIDTQSVSYSDIADTSFGGIGSLGNISIDPLFVNLDIADYRLRPESSLWTAGECGGQIGAYGMDLCN